MYRQRSESSSVRLRRLGALFIDVVPLWLIAAILPLGGPLVLSGVIPMVLAYRMFFALLRRDTFGKSLFYLTVSAPEHSRPSRIRAIVRDVPYLGIWLFAAALSAWFDAQPDTSTLQHAIPALVVLGLLNLAFWDLAVAVLTGDKSLHDLFAGTRVVDSTLPSDVVSRQLPSP